MGQKVHPSLFLIDKYKTYNSIFSLDVNLVQFKYKKRILQDLIYKKLLCSEKKTNIILTFRLHNIQFPELILFKTSSLRELKTLKNLLKLNLSYPKLRIVEFKFPFFSISFILNFIKLQLNITKNIRKILKQTINLIIEQTQQVNPVLGLKLQISGILKPTQQAYTEQISIGTLPLHTKNSRILFCKDYFKTARGMLGIKVWINY